jgi:hypothetical protein
MIYNRLISAKVKAMRPVSAGGSRLGRVGKIGCGSRFFSCAAVTADSENGHGQHNVTQQKGVVTDLAMIKPEMGLC